MHDRQIHITYIHWLLAEYKQKRSRCACIRIGDVGGIIEILIKMVVYSIVKAHFVGQFSSLRIECFTITIKVLMSLKS